MLKQSKVIFLNLFFFAVAVLGGNFSANGQVKPLDDANWTNISSSPLKIGIKESKYPLMNGYFFENLSQGTINSFQLGCITEKNGLVTIQSEIEVLKIEFTPAGTTKSIFYPARSPHGSYLSSKCGNHKVTVTYVAFADGGIWTIKK